MGNAWTAESLGGELGRVVEKDRGRCWLVCSVGGRVDVRGTGSMEGLLQHCYTQVQVEDVRSCWRTGDMASVQGRVWAISSSDVRLLNFNGAFQVSPRSTSSSPRVLTYTRAEVSRPSPVLPDMCALSHGEVGRQWQNGVPPIITTQINNRTCLSRNPAPFASSFKLQACPGVARPSRCVTARNKHLPRFGSCTSRVKVCIETLECADSR